MVSFAFKGLQLPKKTKKWQNTLRVFCTVYYLDKDAQGWSNLIKLKQYSTVREVNTIHYV